MEYIDPKRATDVTLQRIKKEKRLMDCVDCHNRATHIFYSPEQLIDTALAQGTIDKTLPFVKRESLKLLDPASPSLEEALARVETIRQFYRINYPQITVTKQAELAALVEELKEIARLTVFPHMRVDWKTHIDNLAHQEYPGCFRCHGQLIATSGAAKGATIDAKCESCHYALTAEGALAATPIPHTLEGRQDCLLCHGEKGVRPVPADHAGRANDSCTLCHKVAPVSAASIPHRIEGLSDCLLCHSESGIKPFPADHAGRTNNTCTLCHRP